MQQVVPALRIRSYEASSAFYAKLGFKEQWKHQFQRDMPIFASIVRDGMEIFLTEHSNDCQFGALVHFYVENVDKCYAEFQKIGVLIKKAPSNSLSPEIRDMLVVDLDGNRLSFITVSQ
ncbi:MAG: glyoxalase superfamily protein [Cyanobacteria bacterium J06632_19]